MFLCTMNCLSMDALKSQIGETGLWEGLDNNVALRKRGYTGIGKFRGEVGKLLIQLWSPCLLQFRTHL